MEQLDKSTLTVLGYEGAEYEMYDDDGIYKDYGKPENYVRIYA